MQYSLAEPSYSVLQMGLVNDNMDKLLFFVLKSPSKLDRVGKYLSHRLSRDVSRQRYRFVLQIQFVAC